jgi:hypothetical protein
MKMVKTEMSRCRRDQGTGGALALYTNRGGLCSALSSRELAERDACCRLLMIIICGLDLISHITF